MSPDTKKLLMGSVKSGVAALCSLIIALPVTDPLKFSLSSVGGWGHILQVTGIVIVMSEARYWYSWANDKP